MSDLLVCFSCRRYMDEDGIVISQIVSDQEKASVKICKECAERAEVDQWPQR